MTDADESQASGSDYLDADELNSIPKSSSASPEVLLDSSDSEIDLSAASGSEHHPKCSSAPSKQKRRSRSSRQQAESVARVHDSESSSDSSLTPQSPVKSSETSKKSKLNLKAIFAYHFRGKKFKAAAHRKYKCGSGKKKKKKYESTGMPRGRPRLTASPQERKRRLQDRGFQFPFVEKYYGTKHLPLKMVLEYEQAAIKGFLKYIEMLKYEDHLKKSLKALQASEDLEREGLIARKHKYLDDEGPISPIEETNDDDILNSENQDNLDVRVVENSSFILSSKIPKKKKLKPGTKRAKSTQAIETENSSSIISSKIPKKKKLKPGTKCAKSTEVIETENSSFIISSKIPRKKKSKLETKHARSAEVMETEENSSSIPRKKKSKLETKRAKSAEAIETENSSSIISSKIPRKKSKPETKHAKSTEVIEIEEDEDCC